MSYKVQEIKNTDMEINNAPKRYVEVKKKHPDMIVLLRIGGGIVDFYETYCDDAETCADILGITLTMRNKAKSYRMAGFPLHALDVYLPKLIRAGKRVVICEDIK